MPWIVDSPERITSPVGPNGQLPPFSQAPGIGQETTPHGSVQWEIDLVVWTFGQHLRKRQDVLMTSHCKAGDLGKVLSSFDLVVNGLGTFAEKLVVSLTGFPLRRFMTLKMY